jgi:type IV pilus assembly protein PilE
MVKPFDRTLGSLRGRGFTLIELMIVVVVIGILAAIALPGYMEYVRKSRRAEAITSLNQIAQAQERWRANNVQYTTNLSSTGLNVGNPGSGYYVLSVPAATATTYTATASAAGAQLSDGKCTSLSLQMSGGNLTYSSTGTGNANLCWNR